MKTAPWFSTNNTIDIKVAEPRETQRTSEDNLIFPQRRLRLQEGKMELSCCARLSLERLSEKDIPFPRILKALRDVILSAVWPVSPPPRSPLGRLTAGSIIKLLGGWLAWLLWQYEERAKISLVSPAVFR